MNYGKDNVYMICSNINYESKDLTEETLFIENYISNLFMPD